MQIKIKKLRENAVVPCRATQGSAGMDLCACTEVPLTIRAGERLTVPTGIAVGVPAGYASFVFARSGLGVKRGIGLSNGVGVIDSDYTGEIQVGLINLGQEDYTIQPGERVAQMVVMPVCMCEPELVTELDETDRGDGGFGSTGRI